MAADPRPPAIRPRSCVNADGTAKATYPNRTLAHRVARRCGVPGLNAYPCSLHGWHIGHRPEWLE